MIGCLFVAQEGGASSSLFGTGPKGVPKELFGVAGRHLDITFGGYSLETCTALGAVVAVIAHRLRFETPIRFGESRSNE